jgi:hypothetical protein
VVNKEYVIVITPFLSAISKRRGPYSAVPADLLGQLRRKGLFTGFFENPTETPFREISGVLATR